MNLPAAHKRIFLERSKFSTEHSQGLWGEFKSRVFQNNGAAIALQRKHFNVAKMNSGDHTVKKQSATIVSGNSNALEPVVVDVLEFRLTRKK
jgi:hypothetical protein